MSAPPPSAPLPSPPVLLDQIEALIRRDPAGRGLISSEPFYGPLCPGHLAQAAANLASSAQHVGIVTGFFVPDAEPPAAETDGPSGAALLAAALEAMGVRTTLVTDRNCEHAVRAAAAAASLDTSRLAVCPIRAAGWTDEFLQHGPGKTLTHLVAIERVGPSHDEASLARQKRCGEAPLRVFRSRVPSANRDRCHNMRGARIDDSTAPLHLLFERGPQHPPQLKTIGIGDGGNEIGMGIVPWEDLSRRLLNQHSACIPCRIATDWNIVAGTSNWGAFALAAATLWLAGRSDALSAWDEGFQRSMLERMVTEGSAIDGITRRREATVDGLPFATYIQTWLGIRRLIERAGQPLKDNPLADNRSAAGSVSGSRVSDGPVSDRSDRPTSDGPASEDATSLHKNRE